MASDKLPSDLCVDKYSKLKIYFEDYDWEDIRSLSEEDLVEIAQPAHRIRMKQFFRQHLAEVASQPDIFAASSTPPQRTMIGIKKRVLLPGGVLDLRYGLLTSKMSHLKTCRPDLTPLDDFPDEVREWTDEERKEVKSLNLCGALFFDHDLISIISIIKFFPDCREINLSHTRLHGLNNPDFFTNLNLLMECVDFVNVCHTPLATMDNVTYFSNADGAILKKLIFLSPKRGWLLRVGIT